MTGPKYDVKIQGIERVRPALTDAQEKISKELREGAAAKRLAEEKTKGYQAREKRLFAKKLALARQVFAWGSAFRQTKDYEQLSQFSGLNNLLDPSSLQVYSGEWGHKEPEYHENGSSGCWSRFFLNKDKTFTYTAGYKWAGTYPDVNFKTPQELAEKLNYDYLNDLKESLFGSDEAVKLIVDKLKRG
ncbi:MAG TPA: hypothetical protein VNF06_01535 [Candidatus Aquilonibacter sp.]|nr:hypothetical protein [Candidatus Aquilonibacter sp.]